LFAFEASYKQLEFMKAKETMASIRKQQVCEKSATEAQDVRGGKPDQEHVQSLFELGGLGRAHFKGVDPDEYVRELREGWG
jgi:hypothetical protein